MELPHLWPPASRPDLSAALSEWFDAEPGGELLAAARLRIRIPMPGAVESLNVAAAAAVCLFEAQRQRRQTGGARGS